MPERLRGTATEEPINSIARRLTQQLSDAGAAAVVMTGSHVRGDPHQHSDLDLVAIVRKKPTDADGHSWLRPYRVEAGTLVAVAGETPASARGAFRSPRLAPTFVPGWRDAAILNDPWELAARVKRAAERWTWDSIAGAADDYVAEQTTGLAEEVHKLVGTLERGDVHVAAAQRSILAVHLSGIMAVRYRILFGSDNVLWDLVARQMGARWKAAAVRSAFGAVREPDCFL